MQTVETTAKAELGFAFALDSAVHTFPLLIKFTDHEY